MVEYEKIKKNSEKELEYRKMIMKLDPWNAVNYFEMGLIYKQKGDQLNMIKMKELILNFAAATEIADKAAQELI